MTAWILATMIVLLIVVNGTRFWLRRRKDKAFRSYFKEGKERTKSGRRSKLYD